MRTDWYPDRTNHHADETVLRLSFAALRASARHVVPLEEWHGGKSHTETDQNGDEHQASDTLSPVVVANEDDGVAEEECVLRHGQKQESWTRVQMHSREDRR